MSQAGWWGWSTWGNASTSSYESYFRGMGAYCQGQGDYLKSLGQYQINHQQAKRLQTENYKQHVETRWQIRDAYQERVRRQNPNYVDVRNRALDGLEKMHALKEREHELRQKGVLPPLKPQRFVYQGVDYGTYANFKKSPAFAQIGTLHAAMKAKELQMEAKVQEAIQNAIERHNPALPPLLVPEVPFGDALPPRR